ncbi:MAG: membrane protein [Bradymonadia bacterium]|jgi:membrane protein
MKTLRDRVDALHDFAVANDRRGLRYLAGCARLLMNMWRQLVIDDALLAAAALAYTSLLAMVPLLAVSFSLLKAFVPSAELSDQVREWMLTTLLADSINDIVPFIRDILERAGSGAIGLVGFSFLLITSVSLFFSVEKAFNRVWRVSAKRPVYVRLTTFYSVITLAPALIGLGFIVDGWITARLGPLGGGALSVIIPWALQTLALTLMYKLLPHARVRWSAALTGGIVAAIGFELTQVLFNLYVTSVFDGSVRAQIYGGFSMVPIFCLWLYILWVIILGGVEVSYLAQHYQALNSAVLTRKNRREGVLPPAPTAYLIARIFCEIAEHFRALGGGLSRSEVAKRLHVELDEVQPVLALLQKGGLLLMASSDDGEQAVPARPLAQVTLAMLVQLAQTKGYSVGELPGDGELERRIRDANQASDAVLAITVADLLTQSET